MKDVFHFQQFSIRQERCAMKVGTDGVLLGAWANPVPTPTITPTQLPLRILDIGTGTGLIALMLAQRFPRANIQAIELEKNAYEQAKQNIQQSKWADRVQLQYCSLQTFVKNKEQQYDFIVSNPPYFSAAPKAKTIARTQARHTDTLSPTTLLTAAAQLLTPNGTLCVVLPFSMHRYFRQQAAMQQLFIHQFVQVCDQVGSPVKRLLLQLHPSFMYPVRQQLLILKDSVGQRSVGFRELGQNFYINYF